MATEDIEYLIKADDQATAKIKGFSEQTVREMKEIGAKTKASTELAGTLANTLGGNMFGQAAGSVAQLTERMSAFSDVAKSGGAGALAFRGGMVAATAAIGFEFGQAIGSAIFGVEKFKQELADTREEAAKLAATMTTKFENTLKLQQELAELTGSEAEVAFFERLQTELDGVGGSIDRTKKKIEEMQNNFLGVSVGDADIGFQSENHKENIKSEQENLKALEERRDMLRSIRDEHNAANNEIRATIELRKQENQSADYIENLKEQVQLAGANRAEQIQLIAAKNATTAIQEKEIAQLLTQQDAIVATRKLEEEAAAVKKQALIEEANLLKQQQGVYKSLHVQFVQMAKGAKEADFTSLLQQGFNSDAADRIAEFKDLMRQANELSNTKSQVAPDVQAKESRLLGGGGRTIDKAEIAAREQKQRDEALKKIQIEALSVLQQISRLLNDDKIPEAGPV